MADNSPEKPEVAAPVASTEDKVAGEGELAAKTVEKSEGDATMEEAKDAEGELSQRACSTPLAQFSNLHLCQFSMLQS
jgi:hypothetical protein